MVGTAGADGVDASLAYTICCWPVLDPYARYLYAQESNNARLAASSEAYFLSQDTMKEGNPQHILERGEKVELPPTLLIQGTKDDNVPLSIPQRFETAFSGAGGDIQVEYLHRYGSRLWQYARAGVRPGHWADESLCRPLPDPGWRAGLNSLRETL